MLNAQFILDKEDFLLHDLFLATQSNFGKKSRKRLRYLLSIFLSLFAGLMFYWSLFFQGIFYLLFALCCFIFFPVFQYKRHRRYFSNFAEDKYSELFGKVFDLSLDEAYIYMKVLSSESKIAFDDVKEIIDYFSIRLKLGRTVLIPKKQLGNFEEINSVFSQKVSWSPNYWFAFLACCWDWGLMVFEKGGCWWFSKGIL